MVLPCERTGSPTALVLAAVVSSMSTTYLPSQLTGRGVIRGRRVGSKSTIGAAFIPAR